MIVDDEKSVLDVTKTLLENLGYTVLPVESGQDAIDLYRLRSADIDLVLLDMVMPSMGGGETFDRLKAIKPDIKAILSSGYSLSDQAKAIMEKGVAAFIQKPFRLDDLSRKLRYVLEHEIVEKTHRENVHDQTDPNP